MQNIIILGITVHIYINMCHMNLAEVVGKDENLNKRSQLCSARN